MLLRRIAQHVKDQNWFAVALDFIIVVAGILIAFQITNWNEARVEKQREKVLLERLQFDFDRIVIWGERIMPRVNSAPEDTSWLIEKIRTDDKPELNNRFRSAAEASVFAVASFEISPTYQELVSTGTLSRISSPELRDALANYGRNRQAEKIVTEGLYTVQNRGVMRKAIQFQTHSGDPTQSFQVSLDEIMVPISFDWEALKRTEPHLHVVLQNQLYIRGWKQNTFRDAKQALKLLNAELGLQDKPSIEEAK